ncbi:putative phosphoribosyl-ATP pyrophosphohydrolase [Sinorhizobium phage phiM6]|nr:putative phosphoribosyl-ATP pyrophosphohydrolase [Sinorhizobium phage phiM6]
MFDQVKEFHEAFGLAVNGRKTHDLLLLRFNLHDEEHNEVANEFANLDEARTKDEIREAKISLTKEIADNIYVLLGTAVALGLPIVEVFDEVHKSNMSKLGEDGKPVYREDGKVLKGPNYKIAEISKFFP